MQVIHKKEHSEKMSIYLCMFLCIYEYLIHQSIECD